jgi:hypothetical protein
MLLQHRGFRLNELICRRYPGAFRHPLDPALLDLPWWLKEAIALVAAEERGGGPGDYPGAPTWPTRWMS